MKQYVQPEIEITVFSVRELITDHDNVSETVDVFDQWGEDLDPYTQES